MRSAGSLEAEEDSDESRARDEETKSVSKRVGDKYSKKEISDNADIGEAQEVLTKYNRDKVNDIENIRYLRVESREGGGIVKILSSDCYQGRDA